MFRHAFWRLNPTSRVLRSNSRPITQNSAPRPVPYRETVLPPSEGRVIPSWVFSARGIVIITAIPITVVYQVLYADFGPDEHVFMPVRRWLDTQKSRFFSLSPAEQDMARRELEQSNSART